MLRLEYPISQYLLSVYNDYSAAPPSPERLQRFYAAVGEFDDALRASGGWLLAGGLAEPTKASVVSAKDGQTLTTEGPYLETREHVGGFWVIEATDRDTAMEWAGKGSAACGAPIEVRPIQGG